MTLKIRRILYISFILIFLIITPLLWLYAAGYGIGSGFSIQKTGILILDSEPPANQIYLNNEIQQNFMDKLLKRPDGYIGAPAKIKNLAPGEYEIKMELAGYWPWIKKLHVNPGESTFAEDVILFRKDLPIIIANGNYTKYFLNNNQIIASADAKLLLFSEAGENKSLALPDLKNDSEIILSPDKKETIASNQIVNLENPDQSLISLNALIGKGAKNIKWGEDRNEIYYSTLDSISVFDRSNQVFSTIIKDYPFTDYLPKDKYLYFIAKTGNASELNILEKDKKEIIKKISLPESDYAFINPENEYINLYDRRHQIIYLIEALSPFKPLRETINNATQAVWMNENKLLFANDFEIWIMDVANSQKTLLTRISRKIETIIAHPNKNYVIYSTDKDINILELDNREKYNINKLIELEEIKNVRLNTQGDALYFYTKIGHQEGIYKLMIQ